MFGTGIVCVVLTGSAGGKREDVRYQPTERNVSVLAWVVSAFTLP